MVGLVFSLCLPWIDDITAAENAVPVTPAVTRAQLEGDWLVQARLRYGKLAGAQVTPVEDAAGACDGVINGQWGFHTEMEDDPWWQVDLGHDVALGQLRIYNRCDGFEGRASQIQVLLSSDGQTFRLTYGHDGSLFRGFPDKAPLVVPMGGQVARFVRLHLPGKVYFHLDEVEVLADGAETNIALNKPATQSSVSQWSVRHSKSASMIDWPTVVRTTVERGRRLAATLQSMGVAVEVAAAHLDAVDRRAKGETAADDEAAWQALYFRRAPDGARSGVGQSAAGLRQHPVRQAGPHDVSPLVGPVLRLVVAARRRHLRARRLQVAAGHHALPDRIVARGQLPAPDLSYDGNQVLFAYCQYDPSIANERNKRDKKQRAGDRVLPSVRDGPADGSVPAVDARQVRRLRRPVPARRRDRVPVHAQRPVPAVHAGKTRSRR